MIVKALDELPRIVRQWLFLVGVLCLIIPAAYTAWAYKMANDQQVVVDELTAALADVRGELATAAPDDTVALLRKRTSSETALASAQYHLAVWQASGQRMWRWNGAGSLFTGLGAVLLLTGALLRRALRSKRQL